MNTKAQIIQLQNNIAWHTYIIEQSKLAIAEWQDKLDKLQHEDCDNCALHQSDDPKEIDEDFPAQEYMEMGIMNG